tara:strand:- start:331 stop:1263 length:933 start_codon:yes stop_codon:yes gene_type:complete
MRVAHIGLPKTASTFLQLHYFNNIKSDFFSTQEPFEWPRELNFVYHLNKEIEKYICMKNGLDKFINEKDDIDNKLNTLYIRYKKEAIEFAARNKSTENIILSSEGLYGITESVNKIHMKLLRYSSIEKIIFIIRNQTDWIESFWKQLIVKEDRFSKFIREELIFDIFYSMNWLNYFKSITSVYGCKNVLVLPYEMLQASPMMFYEKLNDFIGKCPDKVPDFTQKLNISSNSLIYKGSYIDEFPLIFSNRYIRKAIRKLSSKLPGRNFLVNRYYSIDFNRGFSMEMQSKYKCSNKELASIIDIDLSKYNYY